MISALVSAYYAAKFLPARLENLAQNGCELVVICQAGSKEETIARDYDALVVTTAGIPTIGKAWNLGIKAAHGDYLTTANSDDKFAANAPNLMADVLDQNPDIGLVFGDVTRKTGTSRKPWKRVNIPDGRVEGIHQMLSARCFIGPMPMWRKALHNKHGYFDETFVVMCDYDYWLRLARGGVGFWYIPQSLGVYADRKNSLEHRNKGLMPGERKRVMERNIR